MRFRRPTTAASRCPPSSGSWWLATPEGFQCHGRQSAAQYRRFRRRGWLIQVTNLAINNLDESADLVITHQDLTERARRHAPHARHLSLQNSSTTASIRGWCRSWKAANDDHYQQPQAAANDDHYLAPAPTLFTLSADNIRLGLKATDKESAIRTAGQLLVAGGFVEPEYGGHAATRAVGSLPTLENPSPSRMAPSKPKTRSSVPGYIRQYPGWCALRSGG